MFGRQNDNWAWDAKQVGDFFKADIHILGLQDRKVIVFTLLDPIELGWQLQPTFRGSGINTS